MIGTGPPGVLVGLPMWAVGAKIGEGPAKLKMGTLAMAGGAGMLMVHVLLIPGAAGGGGPGRTVPGGAAAVGGATLDGASGWRADWIVLWSESASPLMDASMAVCIVRVIRLVNAVMEAIVVAVAVVVVIKGAVLLLLLAIFLAWVTRLELSAPLPSKKAITYHEAA